MPIMVMLQMSWVQIDLTVDAPQNPNKQTKGRQSEPSVKCIKLITFHIVKFWKES